MIMNFQNPDVQILKDKKLYIFDMDGTIYLGYQVFPFAIRFINHLRAAGKKVLFFTNNASHTTDFYVQKLSKLGFSPTKGVGRIASLMRCGGRNTLIPQGVEPSKAFSIFSYKGRFLSWIFKYCVS